MSCESVEITEALVEQPVDEREIDCQLAVYQHVAESRHALEPLREVVGQNAESTELADGARVVRHLPALAGGDVSCDVQDVPGAELKNPLDDPLLLLIAPQVCEISASVPREQLQRFSKRFVPRPDISAAVSSARYPKVESFSLD